MIFKRFAANLRAQNWFAIAIELGIVIVGVFVGTLVANWNQSRIDIWDTHERLEQVRPDLVRLARNLAASEAYYATTRRYADVALAGWRGDPNVSDRDFVIGPYQASQVYALTVDSATWASVMGADQFRSLNDVKLRRGLAEVVYADYSVFKSSNLYTDYRKNVRRQIPLALQERIRARCGDRSLPNGDVSVLPSTCALPLAPDEAAAVAAKLRAHRELVEDLDYHFAVVAVAVNASQGAGALLRALVVRLDRYLEGRRR
jgi:hypothetical protein